MESSTKIPHHRHHCGRRRHQQQQQLPLQEDDQLFGSSATTPTTLEYPSGYAAPSSHAWNSDTILNSNCSFDSSTNAAILHSRNPRFQHDILVSSLKDSITYDQDLSFTWGNTNTSAATTNNYTNNQSCHESQLSRINGELSNSCPNLSEMISSPSSSIEDVQLEPTSYGKNDPNVKLLLSTLSSGGRQSNIEFQSCPEEFYRANSSNRSTLSQIYPTIIVSNYTTSTGTDQASSMANSGSFEMNSRALNLLNPARLGGDFRLQSLQDQLGISKNSGLSDHGYDYVMQPIQIPSEASNNTTPFSNGVAEEKSSDIVLKPKAPQQTTKRPRLDQSRPACQPFKARKEKLGDRIAALQQLVAPFGKTDTASVLMEAIGYIKFLQNQVETLSVPYLKPSRNKSNRGMHAGAATENGSEERTKVDLKSRGLCLVPMSCLSYMTDTSGSVWPPPGFGGGS